MEAERASRVRDVCAQFGLCADATEALINDLPGLLDLWRRVSNFLDTHHRIENSATERARIRKQAKELDVAIDGMFRALVPHDPDAWSDFLGISSHDVQDAREALECIRKRLRDVAPTRLPQAPKRVRRGPPPDHGSETFLTQLAKWLAIHGIRPTSMPDGLLAAIGKAAYPERLSFTIRFKWLSAAVRSWPAALATHAFERRYSPADPVSLNRRSGAPIYRPDVTESVRLLKRRA